MKTFPWPHLIVLILIIAGYLLRNWSDGSRVRKYILLLVQNRDVRWYDYQFLNCTREQLLYPLTDEQQERIRTCRQLTVNRADVIPLNTISRLWRVTYYHVRYDLSGTDAAGNAFSIQEEGYLQVSIMNIKNFLSPTFESIKGSRAPFPR